MCSISWGLCCFFFQPDMSSKFRSSVSEKFRLRDPTCWFLGHFTLGGQLQVGVWKTDQHRLWAWQAAKVWDCPDIFDVYVSLWIQVPS